MVWKYVNGIFNELIWVYMMNIVIIFLKELMNGDKSIITHPLKKQNIKMF